MKERGHSAHCQHRVLGHVRNAPSPQSLLEFKENPEFSYINGGTDGEGGSFYGMAPVEPERLQDYTSLSTPRTILAARGYLLYGTEEGVL